MEDCVSKHIVHSGYCSSHDSSPKRSFMTTCRFWNSEWHSSQAMMADCSGLIVFCMGA